MGYGINGLGWAGGMVAGCRKMGDGSSAEWFQKFQKMDSGDGLWELLGVGYDTHGMVYE